MLNTVYGSHEALQAFSFQAYQPIFQLLNRDILLPGVGEGVFRPLDPALTAVWIMTVYLGTASHVDPHSRPWLDPAQIAAFTLDGLRRRPDDDRFRDRSPC